MDIVQLRIPYRFLHERMRMSWRELHFGLTNALLDPQAPVEMAVDLASGDRPSATLLELAGASKSEPISALVEQLASDELPRSEAEIREKWLYLVLAWIYESRHTLPDPLRRVEEVYADFGYPASIAKFVRYMPSEAPDLGSREANETRLLESWRQYLEKVAPRYSP